MQPAVNVLEVGHWPVSRGGPNDYPAEREYAISVEVPRHITSAAAEWPRVERATDAPRFQKGVEH